MINILICGDIVGRSGRETIKRFVPILKKQWDLDLVIVNAENACHGFGLHPNNIKELEAYGVDVFTTGNHVWDQKALTHSLDQFPNVLRPLNFTESAPGKGWVIKETIKGKKILILNAQGQLFMEPSNSPFEAIKNILQKYPLRTSVDAIIIDFHGEASSEKQVLGHLFDGKVSVAVGTHTHTPTSDTRILEKGTGFQTDLGMCGDYNSVIGMNKEKAVMRMLRRFKSERLEPSGGEGCLCGIYASLDAKGLCAHISPVRLGTGLINTHPEIIKDTP